MIYHSISQLIGGTPLFSPDNWNRLRGHCAAVLCKLESRNPAGSAKDRIALAMLDRAEQEGLLCPGATIIEPTSGNTGIGLAALAAARGYRMILTMPDTMSRERIRLLQAYGAQIVLTPGAEGMQGAVQKARELAASLPGSFIPSQFDNPANPDAHYRTTGPEIWRDTDGNTDCLIAGVGTGGTLSGAGKFLKEHNPGCCVIAVEPASSPLLSQGKTGKHGLQGIGANFVPSNFDRAICDRIITVTEDEAFAAARELARTEGLLVGISSGAALHAASLWASEPEHAGHTAVVILPDTGDRYLSTSLFGQEP